MKYLLHIDTSTEIGTVAIAADGKLIAHRRNDEQRNHAGSINLMIDDVLRTAGITFKDLSAIAVCAGPGSYTGLRIGMATAKGFCYALDIPLILDDRLTLLAYHAFKEHGKTYSKYVVLLTAREKEYFITVYNNDFSCVLHPQHILEEQVTQNIDMGKQAYLITDIRPDTLKMDVHTVIDVRIHLESWAVYSFNKYNCNKSVNSFTAEPLYLKQVYTHK